MNGEGPDEARYDLRAEMDRAVEYAAQCAKEREEGEDR